MSDVIHRTFGPPLGGSESYWDRERSSVGRVINDVLDRAKEAVGYVRMVAARPSDTERRIFNDTVREVREEKAEWRSGFRETGTLVTPAEKLEKMLGWDAYEKPKVETIARGEWRTDDWGREARTDIGRSADGFHFSNQISTYNHENDPGWSKAFKTQELAEHVAASQLHRDSNWSLEGRRKVVADAVARQENSGLSPDAQRAQKLHVAAYGRDLASAVRPGDRDTQKAIIETSKHHVEQARTVPAEGLAKMEQRVSQATRDAARAVAAPASGHHVEQQASVRMALRQ